MAVMVCIVRSSDITWNATHQHSIFTNCNGSCISKLMDIAWNCTHSPALTGVISRSIDITKNGTHNVYLKVQWCDMKWYSRCVSMKCSGSCCGKWCWVTSKCSSCCCSRRICSTCPPTLDCHTAQRCSCWDIHKQDHAQHAHTP